MSPKLFSWSIHFYKVEGPEINDVLLEEILGFQR